MSTLDAPGYILITGASSGIGKACALYLDRKGYTVFAGVRKAADMDVLRAESSGRLKPLLLDVCDTASIEAARDEVERSTAPAGLDGLINNAGVVLAGPAEYVNLPKFRQLLDVNLLGLLQVTQAFIPLLRRQQGRIINMGSISGRASLPFLGPYAASKFALEALSDSLRMELRPWGIHVSVIEPGNVETPIRDKTLKDIEEEVQRLPPEAHALYGPVFEHMDHHHHRKAMPPRQVAQLVERILTARRPKARYLLGTDARTLLLIEKLPGRLRDAIVGLALPKYGRP